jgi:hypothetical protein
METLATDGDVGKAILRNPQALIDGVDLNVGSDSRFRAMMKHAQRKKRK